VGLGNVTPSQPSRICQGIRRFVLPLALSGTALCAAASISSAQTDSSPPIRVETREVLIPVFVFNQTNTGQDREVLGLTTKDFHVFEDGREQKIQSVTAERLPDWLVNDKVSVHSETSCTPRSLWVGPDIPQLPSFTIRFTQQSSDHIYLVSYVPPPSPEGSCHHVKVKVDHRPKPTVYARDEYCSGRSSIYDALSGTKLGARMEGYANAAQNGKIPVSVQVGALFGTSDVNLVQIAAEFPWRSLKRIWIDDMLYTTIGVLGLVYDKNGTVLARFSDAPCYYVGSKPWNFCDHCGRDRAFIEYAGIPESYVAQIDLPPGDYDVKVTVTDGANFGRAEAPLKVDRYNLDSLAASGVVLCKRYHEALARPKQYHRLVSKNLEYTPAADTTFKSQEPVLAYFQVFEPLLKKTGAANVQFEIRVTDVKTGELKIDTGQRSAESWIEPGNPVISIAEGIIIDKLDSGNYRLEVRASDSAGTKTDWRAAFFTVE
jgi:hypothetical protein